MSKAKHPENMGLLIASDHLLLNFAHICPTIMKMLDFVYVA